MTMYLGDFNPGDTVRFMWNSNDSNGASITRSTNGTISVYQNGNTTQTTTGVTDTEDFDSLTGVHFCAIDTSQDGTFYAAGRDFAVVLSAATIDTRTVNAVLAHFSIQARSALRPTTAGRTLDVSAGGEAGIDWANVGSPTSTVGLSGTTVKTATDVETDTQDIQARLPAALVSGRIDASVGAYQTGLTPLQPTTAGRTLDVTATGAAGIDWANVENQSTAVNLSATNIDVDQVVASVSGAVGSVTGNVGGNITGSVGSIATGGIAAASFAAGAIDNAAIATDAIGSAELAASAITEIQSGLSTLTASQVNAEVVDALATDTYAEPGAAPAATATLAAKIGWLFVLARNKVTMTSTTQTLRNDADSGDIATAAHADDGSTYTRAEWS